MRAIVFSIHQTARQSSETVASHFKGSRFSILFYYIEFVTLRWLMMQHIHIIDSVVYYELYLCLKSSIYPVLSKYNALFSPWKG